MARVSLAAETQLELRVIRRTGQVVGFDSDKIFAAVKSAWLAQGSQHQTKKIDEQVAQVVARALEGLQRDGASTYSIEQIQDQVELALSRSGHTKISSAYANYRADRAEKRRHKANSLVADIFTVVDEVTGQQIKVEPAEIYSRLETASLGLPGVDCSLLLARVVSSIHSGITSKAFERTLVLEAGTLIEMHPDYSYLAARLMMDALACEVTGRKLTRAKVVSNYAEIFVKTLDLGIKAKRLDPRLGSPSFDRGSLAAALKPERDMLLELLGLQTLYDRYFIKVDDRRIEMPQILWMRVAMGLAVNEDNPTARAIEFYEQLSSFRFMSSTPTLFNAGTVFPQLSSCYLSTVGDDLDQIYGAVKDNALLAKFAGGLGNDWTPVRAQGSKISSTGGESQGVVPFLRVVNDTALAVNQCFAPETLVNVAGELKPIRDVAIGDLVLTQSGVYREVTDAMVYRQTGAMTQLHLQHALTPLQVTAGHPLLVQDADGSVQWTEAGRLGVGDLVAQVVPHEQAAVTGFDEQEARLYGILLAVGSYCVATGRWTVDLAGVDSATAEFVNKCGMAHEQEGTVLSFTLQAVRQSVAGTGARGVCASSPEPLTCADVFDAAGRRRISRRLAHLPLPQTAALVGGLLAGAGRDVGRGFVALTGSLALLESLRYQLLRLRIACGGASGVTVGGKPCYRLRVPLTKQLAKYVVGTELAEPDWQVQDNYLLTKVTAVEAIAPVPLVCDLKVDGDASYMTAAALAHNGGKRNGAVCCYLETWHRDIRAFLDLRKNVGDERRRTPDMNTANWIPDLFLKRVAAKEKWTLFSPSDVPDLHELYGLDFEKAYCQYEQQFADGKIDGEQTEAYELWQQMIRMLYETGHPWFTFKDPCNLRSPQRHAGVVHSSNLCTEITLNTSADEIAVCNLGSVNLVRHLNDAGELDRDKLRATVRTAMRMLDNVIDINYYAVAKARVSNLRHRPVGLGQAGFQDCLYQMGVSFASDAAVEFADVSSELIAYYAYEASADLAAERGKYETYQGSLWSQGILPLDTIQTLAEHRASGVKPEIKDGWLRSMDLEMNVTARLDWDALRAKIRHNGMRNSNCLAIAPTATISNIMGVSPCIEPTYKNFYVKSNLSGNFKIINQHLVRDLQQAQLWDDEMVSAIKSNDGEIEDIERIPQSLRERYKTAFNIDSKWLIEAASRRQKWLDQAQSLNLFAPEPSGRKISDMYMLAWRRGLKTTYYCRSSSASSTEKFTTKTTGQQNRVKAQVARSCALDDPDCEACQ